MIDSGAVSIPRSGVWKLANSTPRFSSVGSRALQTLSPHLQMPRALQTLSPHCRCPGSREKRRGWGRGSRVGHAPQSGRRDQALPLPAGGDAGSQEDPGSGRSLTWVARGPAG